ncbi:uncharacterized protein LOC135163251 [Diachasmimorpha longicaudata]|uniref:uncharacterized protein LOC135163251 n=1 Tax=Diachasmimorpha longicaudata TaxID=58733 RepID=UPI0030B8BDC7
MNMLRTRNIREVSPQEVADIQPVQEDLTARLPIECLDHIFKMLGTKEKLIATRVCKRWDAIVTSRSWPEDGNTLNLESYPTHTWQTIAHARGRFTSFLTVDCSEDVILVTEIMHKHFHQLESLTIIFSERSIPSTYTNECFKNFQKICADNVKLRSLHIKADHLSLIEAIVHYLPLNLPSVRLSYQCKQMAQQALQIDLSLLEELKSSATLEREKTQPTFLSLKWKILGLVQHITLGPFPNLRKLMTCGNNYEYDLPISRLSYPNLRV